MISKITYKTTPATKVPFTRVYLMSGPGSHFVLPDSNVVMSRSDFARKIYSCEVVNDLGCALKKLFVTDDEEMVDFEFTTLLHVYHITPFEYSYSETKAHEIAALLGVTIKVTEDTKKASSSKTNTSTLPKQNCKKPIKDSENSNSSNNSSAVPPDDASKKKKGPRNKRKGHDAEKPLVPG
ncbi:unnamed protein product [Bemisia tabaci]|uniref:Uncharacterized protein n=1 Tax=Bemisia tabaci TaxID=7038 RepID=A0A9P0ANW9_BEMTA|nr:unnamed protein product [Bemisia tabaci]